jgi:UDP-N-acetylmuramyl tripeptide synthase
MRATLADYAHNSTSDRRQLITGEQQEAGAAAIRLFGGSPDRDRTR